MFLSFEFVVRANIYICGFAQKHDLIDKIELLRRIDICIRLEVNSVVSLGEIFDIVHIQRTDNTFLTFVKIQRDIIVASMMYHKIDLQSKFLLRITIKRERSRLSIKQ